MSGGKFLQTLGGTHFPTPPIWLMRQAGRYLPEYRAVRATTKSFLDFCYTPDKAVEVTLQPIRRFGLDAAIIFSDILVVPDALGQKVWFEEGEGPRLEALTDPAQFGQLSRGRLTDFLQPVYRAIKATRATLPAETALLGFAGAPFTLACYMIEGGGSRDFAKVKLWAYRHPESFGLLIDLLIDARSYLSKFYSLFFPISSMLLFFPSSGNNGYTSFINLNWSFSFSGNSLCKRFSKFSF